MLYTRKKKSIIETCTQNDIVFDPQFMVSDTARAIVNLIKKAFPNCQYLMCWFHSEEPLIEIQESNYMMRTSQLNKNNKKNFYIILKNDFF